MLEIGEDGNGEFGIAGDDGFRHFKLEACWIDPGLANGRLEFGDKAGIGKLLGRDIHANVHIRHGGMVVLPGLQLLTGFEDQPVAGGIEQAGVLGGGDEMVGRNQALLGMVPAQEGFESYDLSACKLHDGLVMDTELAPGDGFAEFGFELEAVYSAGMHGLIEHFATGAPERFGAAHGDIGVLEKIFGARVRSSAHCNADAGGGANFAVLHDKWLGYEREDTIGNSHGIAGIGDTFEQDGKFISTHSGEDSIPGSELILRPCDCVLIPEDSVDTMAYFNQHLVADCGAHGVVESFETV